MSIDIDILDAELHLIPRPVIEDFVTWFHASSWVDQAQAEARIETWARKNGFTMDSIRRLRRAIHDGHPLPPEFRDAE